MHLEELQSIELGLWPMQPINTNRRPIWLQNNERLSNSQHRHYNSRKRSSFARFYTLVLESWCTVFPVSFPKCFIFYYCLSTCLQQYIYIDACALVCVRVLCLVFLMIYDGLFQICRYKNLATSSIISSCQPITKEPNIGRSIKERKKKIINYKNSP